MFSHPISYLEEETLLATADTLQRSLAAMLAACEEQATLLPEVAGTPSTSPSAHRTQGSSS